jgi:hypothetical protein
VRKSAAPASNYRQILASAFHYPRQLIQPPRIHQMVWLCTVRGRDLAQAFFRRPWRGAVPPLARVQPPKCRGDGLTVCLQIDRSDRAGSSPQPSAYRRIRKPRPEGRPGSVREEVRCSEFRLPSHDGRRRSCERGHIIRSFTRHRCQPPHVPVASLGMEHAVPLTL